jgi:hypothetical protein
MSDDRARATVRLSQESYDRLCAELSAFNTDTARFQFVVQFYLDYKQTGRLPREWDDCTGDSEEANTPTDATDAQQARQRGGSHQNTAQYQYPSIPDGEHGDRQADHAVNSR